MTYRLFIAIDLPPHIVETISNICYGVQGARWVPAEQLHLTLRFIGEADDSLYDEILDQLEEIEFPSFSLALHETGFFPPRKEPKILWIGVDKNELLTKFHATIEKKLGDIGLARDKRKFHPHVTIARLRRKTMHEDIMPFLINHTLLRTEAFEITEFHLYSSILKPLGPVHQIEASFDFRK